MIVCRRRRPWRTVPALTLNGAALTNGVDYEVVEPWGQIKLNQALSADDELVAGAYEVYTGIVAEAQRVVDGDPSNRTKYPGYRGAFSIVDVLPAAVHWLTITGTVVKRSGWVQADVIKAAEAALMLEVNRNPIGAPIHLSNLVGIIDTLEINGLRAVRRVNLTTPTASVYVPPNTVIRLQSAGISLT